MDEWRFQKKIIKFIKTWPVMVFVFIGSGILAGLLVYLFPPVQKATAEFYIGIDMTRVYDVSSLASYAKTEPFNIDDYKNWQLSQVDSIASSDWIADQVLVELRNQDVYWEDISNTDFINMQDIDWYDVGVWKIRIQDRDGKHALNGVEVWRDVLLKELSFLVEESEDVLEIEGRLRAGNQAITSFEIRLIELEQLNKDVNSALEEMNTMDPEAKMTGSSKEQMWDLITGYASDDLLWDKTLSDFPAPGQSISTMTEWLNEVLDRGLSEKENTLEIKGSLERDQELILEDYRREIEEAQGLSASLYIKEQVSDPYLESYYPASVVGIIGSFVGLLVYIILWVMLSDLRAVEE